MLCLIKKIMRRNLKRIQSKLHRIGTYDVCKTSLSCFDDKRYFTVMTVKVMMVLIVWLIFTKI